MFLKNGQNVKVNGCIYNLFLILQILQNNLFKNQRNSRLLTQLGSILWNKLIKVFLSFKCVLKMVSSNVFSKQTKTSKLFKKNYAVILKKREKNSHVFTSYQIQTYFKFYHKQNNHLLYSHI